MRYLIIVYDDNKVYNDLLVMEANDFNEVISVSNTMEEMLSESYIIPREKVNSVIFTVSADWMSIDSLNAFASLNPEMFIASYCKEI